MYEKLKGSYSWDNKWFESREEAINHCIRNKGIRKNLSDFEKLNPEQQSKVKEKMNNYLLESMSNTQ